MTSSSVCSHNNSISWIAAFSLFLICGSFSGYGFLSLLFTSLVLISCTFLFMIPKQKNHVLVENEAIISSVEDSPLKVEEVISKEEPESETISQNKQETQEENGVDQINGAAELYWESESIDDLSTSEDSDVGCPYSGEAGRSRDLSDGSISDEESLIEIAIPTGQYVSPKEEDPKLCLPLQQQKLPNFSAEDIFGQHGLMELVAEYNEEENLIEIDLSMGSIKCSRFEIKA